MRKEPQIFVRANRKGTPVEQEILSALEQEIVEESLLREYVRKKLLAENKLSGRTIEGVLSLLDGYASNTWVFLILKQLECTQVLHS